jgi:hypothetical protein
MVVYAHTQVRATGYARAPCDTIALSRSQSRLWRTTSWTPVVKVVFLLVRTFSPRAIMLGLEKTLKGSLGNWWWEVEMLWGTICTKEKGNKEFCLLSKSQIGIRSIALLGLFALIKLLSPDVAAY